MTSKRIGWLASIIIILAFFLVACSEPSTGGSESSGGTSPIENDSGADETSGGPAESFGQEDTLDEQALVEDLRAAGATVALGDTVEQPFFSVTGQVIAVNDGDVQFFIYEGAEAAEEQAALVSPAGDSVGTSIMMWMGSPHFYRLENVIALYVGDDSSVIGALETALGGQFAGAE
jgi:hypothetical protein